MNYCTILMHTFIVTCAFNLTAMDDTGNGESDKLIKNGGYVATQKADHIIAQKSRSSQSFQRLQQTAKNMAKTQQEPGGIIQLWKEGRQQAEDFRKEVILECPSHESDSDSEQIIDAVNSKIDNLLGELAQKAREKNSNKWFRDKHNQNERFLDEVKISQNIIENSLHEHIKKDAEIIARRILYEVGPHIIVSHHKACKREQFNYQTYFLAHCIWTNLDIYCQDTDNVECQAMGELIQHALMVVTAQELKKQTELLYIIQAQELKELEALEVHI